MQLTLLGTGNALATHIYNTCFVLSDGESHVLVDGGGGNGLFTQLEKAGLSILEIHHIIMTHKHTDHFFGVIWALRAISQQMNAGAYEGDAYFYGHDEVITLLEKMAQEFLPQAIVKNIHQRIHLITVHDGEIRPIINREFVFLDIHSTKAKQYGFRVTLDDGYLTCLGDEPYCEEEREYVSYAKWLLCEAFCLKSEADLFHPYEKHHSTVYDAAKLAEDLHVRHLVLYHSEEGRLNKLERYLQEAQSVYSGDLHIPHDLEKIDL